MLFCSQPFLLVFLPACLLAARAARRLPSGTLCIVLAASLVFYGWSNPPELLLLGGSIAANYLIGQRILAAARDGQARRAGVLLAAGVGGNLLLLGWFKYADFAAGIVGLAPPHPALPLAISFFTFQQIMFLADSRRSARPDRGFLPYAGFVAFFPHLIAGPIVRPDEVMPQLVARRFGRCDRAEAAAAITLFLIGLAKKIVLADTFAHYADPGFAAAAAGERLTLLEAWTALLAYGLQIYFDFSGYSDMAIALARLLGVRFPINFDAPYKARSIAEFWRRWHITLGRFLRDYVYIPLGGSRRGAWRQAGALLATMLLAGLWHGAGWAFVAWGGLHGVYLAIHAAWRRAGLMRLPGACAQALTLLCVLLAWVPFRAGTLAASLTMLHGLAGLDGVSLPRLIVAALPALGRIATPVPVLTHLGDARTLALPEAMGCLALGWAIVLAAPPVHRLSARLQTASLTAGFAFSVQALFYAPTLAPFVYFRF